VFPRARDLATDSLPATFDHYGARFRTAGRGPAAS
jgi:hypothetical protein